VNLRRLFARSLLAVCCAAYIVLFAAWLSQDLEWFARPWHRLTTSLIASGFIFLSALAVGLLVLIVRGRTAAAENTEDKFRSLLDAAPDPMVIMNGEGVVTLVNARAEHLFGAARETLVGRPVDDLLCQSGWRVDPIQSTRDYYGSSTQVPFQEPQLQVRRADGRCIPVEISFSPLKTAAGSYTISIIRDVTERKMFERLQNARHAVRRILADKSSLDGAAPLLLQAISETLRVDRAVLWTVDPSGRALRRSESWRQPPRKEEGGKMKEDQKGDPSYFPSVSLPAPSADGLAKRVWASGEPEWPAAPAEGDSRVPVARGPSEAVGFPILFGTEVLGVIECFNPEVRETEQPLRDTLYNIGSQIGRFLKHAQAEEAVRRSEARKAAILESALDAIITIDHEGKILEYNPAAERLFGHRRADAFGQDLFALVVPPASHDAFRKTLIDCVAPSSSVPHPSSMGAGEGVGSGFGKRLELSLKSAGGEELPAELALTRIQSYGPALFTCYIRDLRERKQGEDALKRTEEQFRQAQKMEAVGRLAGGVAHDFNNLLTVINGYTQTMLLKLPATDPNRGRAELIYKAGVRAAGLTRQLLAFSRKQRLELTAFQLNTVVADLGKMLQRLIGEDVHLATIAAPDLRPIKADLGQIEQVIMNLAVNARDAMPNGGKLMVETANVELNSAVLKGATGAALAHPSSFTPNLPIPEVRPGSYVMLAISDTGIGMTEEVKARVFEPFFTTKEVGKGTGLGLAMVYGIIKQSGGHIAVYSEPGHGTTFKIYLPCADETPVPPVSPSRRLMATPRGQGTVLLVEDEDMVRTIGKEILQEQGYTVLEARHGREALDLSEEEMDSIKLTVTDVVMPEMDGRELAQRLLCRKPDMKVLYVSGYTNNAAIRNGLLPPGTAFLEKPFTPESLARKVHEVLAAAE
jgi:PAS domain S-box-containing protein